MVFLNQKGNHLLIEGSVNDNPLRAGSITSLEKGKIKSKPSSGDEHVKPSRAWNTNILQRVTLANNLPASGDGAVKPFRGPNESPLSGFMLYNKASSGDVAITLQRVEVKHRLRRGLPSLGAPTARRSDEILFY